MSPYLENFRCDKYCQECGEPLMFENGVPLQSDGEDHRNNPDCPGNKSRIDWAKIPKCKECGVRVEPGREFCAFHEKPRWKPLAVEHEKQHEGQQELSRWWR